MSVVVLTALPLWKCLSLSVGVESKSGEGDLIGAAPTQSAPISGLPLKKNRQAPYT